jgi:carboxyl-terminal processing protease
MKLKSRYWIILSLSSIIVALGVAFSPAVFSLKEEKDATTATETVKGNVDENDINRFTSAISQIKDFYVQDIGDKKLLEDAIRGMLSGLDPHSEYLDADAYKTLLMTTSGAFAGLGVEVTTDSGVLKVISPIDGTPAFKAGIKPADYIVAIDGKLVHDMTLRDAVDKMRGKKGTAVTLTVLRKGEKKPLFFKLIRDTINIESIKSNMLATGYGYIRLSQFQQNTTAQLLLAIKKLQTENKGNLKGLVLDLRNNPGGLLETAVQVANTFLDSKKLNNKYRDLIVYTEGRLPSASYEAKATGQDLLAGAPIVVLVNEGSASASEIVAGALQDYHRAVIAGTPSFGKGSVQTVLPLDDSHAIKLTTALYHTPSGRTIQNKGIIPDIIIENLKISANTDKLDESMIEPIHEFNLKGHLLGKEAGTSTDEKVDAAETAYNNISLMNLATTDFQLYEALKILKGMYAQAHDDSFILAPTVPTTTSAQK